MNKTDGLIKNGFVDWCLKIVPDDPIMQSLYVYCLSVIVFVGLMGFSIASWVQTFTNFAFTTMFRALFMTAISMLSLYGLKQTRTS